MQIKQLALLSKALATTLETTALPAHPVAVVPDAPTPAPASTPTPIEDARPSTPPPPPLPTQHAPPPPPPPPHHAPPPPPPPPSPHHAPPPPSHHAPPPPPPPPALQEPRELPEARPQEVGPQLSAILNRRDIHTPTETESDASSKPPSTLQALLRSRIQTIRPPSAGGGDSTSTSTAALRTGRGSVTDSTSHVNLRMARTYTNESTHSAEGATGDLRTGRIASRKQ